MTGTLLDGATRRVTLTRAQLQALTDHAADRAPASEQIEDLHAAGALANGTIHPLLRPVLKAVTTARHRGALRRWQVRTLPVAEILLGPHGVLLLPGGPDPDAPQDLTWHDRPPAVARIIAELLALPTDDGPAPFDRSPRPWADLVAAATSGPDTPLGLAELRWTDQLQDQMVAVLVVAWHHDGGIVAVRPVDTTPDRAGDAVVQCIPRHPLEIWTGLTRLTTQNVTMRKGQMRCHRVQASEPPFGLGLDPHTAQHQHAPRPQPR